MRPLICLMCCAGLLAQQPAPPPDLQKLAEAVDAVHRPDGNATRFHGFHARLELEQKAKAEDRGMATLEVTFLEHQAKTAKKAVPLIRYRIIDSATPVERGHDLAGYWQLLEGKPRDLETKDTVAELEAARRDTNLARQLLRLLDIGAVLRSLQQPQPVATAELKVGRTEPIACRVATGTLPSFPRLYEGGDDTAVQVKVWIASATNQLLAIELWPLSADGKPDLAHGERLRLDDFKLQDHVKLPMRMVHYRAGADGQWLLQTEVRLIEIALDPPLQPEQFDRNR